MSLCRLHFFFRWERLLCVNFLNFSQKQTWIPSHRQFMFVLLVSEFKRILYIHSILSSDLSAVTPQYPHIVKVTCLCVIVCVFDFEFEFEFEF
jgi:hypothetical protein